MGAGNAVTKILKPNQKEEDKAFYSNGQGKDNKRDEQEVIISVHQKHSTARS